jgi:hypothetical protein
VIVDTDATARSVQGGTPMRLSFYGTLAVTKAAAGALVLVHGGAMSGFARPDAARAVVVLVATPDLDVRGKVERPLAIVARAGQSSPGQPTTVDPTPERQPATRARLAAGDGAWPMGGAPGAAPPASAPPGGAAGTLATIASPMATGMPSTFSQAPAWMPTGTSGSTLGGTPVAPPFAMTFGAR